MGRETDGMTGKSVMALVLILVTALLGIRHALRNKCLGGCAHCSRAGACAVEKEKNCRVE